MTNRPRHFRSPSEAIPITQESAVVEGGYLVLLILAVLFDIGVSSGGHRAMKRK
jgi:hypothetical protein